MTNLARARGMTLIELMVAAAMASIAIAAALAVFISIGERQRRSERVFEAQSAAVLSASVLEFAISGAGYRFPSAAFAVRTIDNVTSSTALASNGPNITTTGNCGGAGLIEGTDVVELSSGFPFIGPGKVTSALVTGTSATFTLGGLTEPFNSAEVVGGTAAPGVGTILLFQTTAGRA